MFTLDKAGEVLGLTPRQVYRRIAAARPLLGEHLRTGANGALILDSGALEILRRAEDLRRSGVTVEDAIARIAEEMGGNGGGEAGRAAGEPPEVSGPWQLLLREKDARITALEEEVRYLRGLVDRLPALPPGKERNPWWWPLRRFVFGG